MLKVFNFLFLFGLAVQVAVGVTYPGIQPGLAARTSAGPFYCLELQSSGGDDDAMILVFVVMLVSMAVRIINLRTWPRGRERVVYWSSWALVALGLLLATLDCAQLLYTVFAVPDLILGAGLAAWLATTALMTTATLTHK